MLGNYMNFNRNWIVVNSDKSPDSDEATLRSDIIANIKAGNFYTVARCPRTLKDSFKEDTGTDGPSDIGVELHIAVIGPTLYAPTTVYVSTTRESTITFTGFRKIPRVEKFTDTYENKKEASYPINHSEIYVRVEIKQTGLDGQEYIAYSQPMFVIIPGPQ
jgi:hypothetical protein